MKVGIIADSHDNLPMIRKALAAFRSQGAECVIHAGDFIAPFAVKELLQFPGPVYGVFGNNDGEKEGISKIWPEIAVGPSVFEMDGKRILVAHRKDDANEDEIKKADVFIYAHSHKPEITRRPTADPSDAALRPETPQGRGKRPPWPGRQGAKHSRRPIRAARMVRSTVLINPGGCGGWLSGRSTVALLDLETLDAKIIELSYLPAGRKGEEHA